MGMAETSKEEVVPPKQSYSVAHCAGQPEQLLLQPDGLDFLHQYLENLDQRLMGLKEICLPGSAESQCEEYALVYKLDRNDAEHLQLGLTRNGIKFIIGSGSHPPGVEVVRTKIPKKRKRGSIYPRIEASVLQQHIREIEGHKFNQSDWN